MALEFGVEQKKTPREFLVAVGILWVATPSFMAIFYALHRIHEGSGPQSIDGLPAFLGAALVDCYKLFLPPHFGSILAPVAVPIAAIALPLYLMKSFSFVRSRSAFHLMALLAGAIAFWIAWVSDVALAHMSWRWIQRGMLTANWELAPAGAVVGLIAARWFDSWMKRQLRAEGLLKNSSK